LLPENMFQHEKVFSYSLIVHIFTTKSIVRRYQKVSKVSKYAKGPEEPNVPGFLEEYKGQVGEVEI
jgi:hypothetical protein